MFAGVMSCGLAYVFVKRAETTEKRCNLDSVDLEPVLESQDARLVEGRLVKKSFGEVKLVQDLVVRHLGLTRSPRAAWILDNWSEALSRFIKVFPHEHKRVLGVSRRNQPYIPSPALTAVAQAEQVQHG